MIQEDKELLLKDLSARLPYGVMVRHDNEQGKSVDTRLVGYNGDWFNYYIDNLCYHLKVYEFKPYLRSMDDMTEEEKREYNTIAMHTIVTSKGFVHLEASELVDWLNAHHFDYRGLIEKGLAIAVTEKNNPYKE